MFNNGQAIPCVELEIRILEVILDRSFVPCTSPTEIGIPGQVTQ